MEKLYYVYILASRSRVLYTGVTGRLLTRIKQHRDGTVPGFTKRYRIHRLVYFETFHDVRRAIWREKQIKRGIRAKRVALIEKRNPSWEDLAEGLFAQSREKQIPRLPKPQARDDSCGQGRGRLER